MVSEAFGSLWDPRRGENVFFIIIYDIKYQEVVRKHMGTSADKEHSNSGCRHTPFTQEQHWAATTTQHTRSSTSTKTKSCHNNELLKHIHSVLL